MDAMEAIEELGELSESMRQAAALLADEDVDENSNSRASSRRAATFLNVVALGNVVSSPFLPFSVLVTGFWKLDQSCSVWFVLETYIWI